MYRIKATKSCRKTMKENKIYIFNTSKQIREMFDIIGDP